MGRKQTEETRRKQSLANGGKGVLKEKYCLFCGKENKKFQKFCSCQCHSDYRQKVFEEKWFNGLIDASSKSGHSSHVKRYLLKKFDNKCSKCGWSEINPFTKTLPLEIEHVDGNAYNNLPNNVTLLCPNCQSLTKTFRGANRGNGRRYYLKKYYMKDSNGKII